MAQEQPVEHVQHVIRGHLRSYLHGQGLAGELVEYCEHLVAAAIAELVVDEVDAPDVVRMGRPESDDGAVLVVEPSPPLVSLRQLQPFLTPDPLDLLVIDPPAFDAQQFGDLAIAVSSVLLGQSEQRQTESVIIPRGWLILQRVARQADDPAGPPFRGRKLLACMDDGLTKLLGRQALGFR